VECNGDGIGEGKGMRANPTPAELELAIVECKEAGRTTRTDDGTLRTYYAGFNLSALALRLSREFTNVTLPECIEPDEE
jgi:hypothetical protein